MSFSASDAAFEGFRQVRRHPVALVFWAVAYIGVFALCFAVAGPLYIDLMARIQSLNGVSNPSPSAIQPMMQSMGLLVILVLPLTLVFGSVLSAAVARAVLRPTDKAFGYMRLGADELRVLGVTIVLFFVIMLVYLVGAALTATIGVVAYSANIPPLWILAVAAGLATAAVLAWLSVRLSLAVPIVVAERRFTVFASFALTKGRFWPLLGMAIIAFVMSILVSLLGSIVVMPFTAMSGMGSDVSALAGQSMIQLLQTAGPAIIGWIVLQSLLAALQLAVVYGPFSAAYRDIKGLPHL